MSADVFWMVVPALLIYLLSTVVSSARSVRIVAMQTRLQETLIGKIASTEDLRAYFDSDLPSGVLRMGAGPAEKALDSVRNGVFLLVAGLSLLIWAFADPRVPVGVGAMTIALGVGCLAAGAATRHLAQRWGLLGPQAETGETRNARG